MHRPALVVAAAATAVLALVAATGSAQSAGQAPVGSDASSRTAAAAPQPRPNIVVIAVDDMAERDLKAMPLTRQLIAKRGVRFTNSFSPFPLCCPARVSLLTGQYAHNHGVLGNGSGVYPEGGYEGFTTDDNTLATWLDDAGYQTAFVGKYLNNYGTECCPARVPPGWDDWHGFFHGAYTRVRSFDNGTEHVHKHFYRTAYTTKVATDLIDERVPRRAPLMMLVWQYAPHNGKPIESDDPQVVLDRNTETPVPAPADRNDFNHTELPDDPSFNEADVSDKPEYVSRRPKLRGKGLEAVEELHQQRLETLQAVDRGVARVVKALHRNGELGNTVLVFTSDNGYLVGQHRIREGKVVPYEPGIRVPLLVRGPGFPAGVTRDQLVGTQDLARTFASIADADPQRVLDGVSLRTLVRHRNAFDGRDMVIEGGPKDIGGPMKFVGLRTQRYTYVEYATGERELYDLRKDPYQLRNLIGTPGLDPELEQRLVTQLAEMRGCAGDECRVETRY